MAYIERDTFLFEIFWNTVIVTIERTDKQAALYTCLYKPDLLWIEHQDELCVVTWQICDDIKTNPRVPDESIVKIPAQPAE